MSMTFRAVASVACAAGLAPLLPLAATAGTVAFFNTNQVATLVATGTTSDTISSEGYLFTYTRDKLFTGGVGLTNPIGRTVRVPWPQGVEAQAVTAGPQPGGARILVSRVDGELFDLAAITFMLLANTAGAGATLEIMPMVNGEDALADPIFFEASGYYGGHFSYDASPNYLGSTAKLTNSDTYKITLYVDFALKALTLNSAAPNMNHAPTDLASSGASVLENEPAGTVVGTLSTTDPDPGDTFTYALVAGAGSADNALFSLTDDQLVTAASFNFEARANYSIRVAATDQGLLATQKVFAIDVVDVVEPQPDFCSQMNPSQGTMIIQWSSIANHQYTVLYATDLVAGFTVLQSNIPATPVINTFTATTDSAAQKYWMLTTEP